MINEREINGTVYKFKMTRKGIRAAEAAGMHISEMSETPMSALSYLWYAAMYAAHPMTIKKTDELLDTYLDSKGCKETIQGLLEDLMNGYSEIFA